MLADISSRSRCTGVPRRLEKGEVMVSAVLVNGVYKTLIRKDISASSNQHTTDFVESFLFFKDITLPLNVVA